MSIKKIEVSSLSIFSISVSKEQDIKKQLTKGFSDIIKPDQFQEAPGIFIYENHDHKFPKHFLITNFQYLKSLGVTTLFWEFSQTEHQELLDTYNSSLPSERPPSQLPINAIDREVYADVIYAAHQAGIRVVGLDSDDARKNSHPDPYYIKCPSKKDWDDYFKEREERFDKNAAKIIKKEHNNQPYICYLGFGHHSVQSFLGRAAYSVFLIDGDYISKSQADKRYLDTHRSNADIFVYSSSLGNNCLLDVSKNPIYLDVLSDELMHKLK